MDIDRFDESWSLALWFAITEGNWSCGYSSKEDWPGKKQFGPFKTYYDGYMIAFHLGGFWINCDF